MRVIIDDGLASYGRMSGIGYSIVNLAQALMEFTECDITQYSIIRRIPRYLRKWAYIGACNISGLYDRYEIVHHLANYVPFARGKNKHLLTIHDFSVFLYPETISLAWRHYNAFSFRKSISRADAIITASTSIRKELLEHFPHVDEQNVFTCSFGIRNSILRAKPVESHLDDLGVHPYSYFLFIGDLTKRKNLEFTIRAFLGAKKQQRLDGGTEFVIIGKPAWGYSEIKELLRGNPQVRALGYLNDRQIVALYRYAKALVYPSLYEGFGIPIVEAMSQGTPIIISNIPTSMELNQAHDNQMLSFDLEDEEGLVRCFQQIDVDSDSIRSRIKYGDLSQYDFRSVAARHVDIYTTILNRM